MAQWNLSGLVRTSDLPVAAKTGSPLAGVASTTWSWRDVAAVAALGRLGPLGGLGGGVAWRAARQCAPLRGVAVPAAPSAARRSAASIPTSPPPSRASPGCRPQGRPSWAPWESMGLMMAGGRRATGGDAASSAPNLRRFCGRSFAYSAAPPVLRAGPPGADPCRPVPGP